MIPDWLIVLGLVLAYLAAYFTIGVLYARSQAVKIYRKQWARHRRMYSYTPDEKITEYAERATREDLRAKAWYWPFAMLRQFFVALGDGRNSLLMRPVHERQRKAEELRRDAQTWDAVATHPNTTESEREMAVELARVLREAAEREAI